MIPFNAFELLHERELLALVEDVAVLLGFLFLTRFGVGELVFDGHGQVVVVVHREGLHIEVRSHHSTVQSGTSGHGLDGIERALELLLLENLLDDSLHDGSTSAVSDQLNELNLVRRKT